MLGSHKGVEMSAIFHAFIDMEQKLQETYCFVACAVLDDDSALVLQEQDKKGEITYGDYCLASG